MTKQDWKQARTVRLMVTSPSQFEAAELCVRKWWLKWVRKLPDPVTASRAFGTVMHAVIDRFLSADDLGRKNGVLVGLYPEGWTKATNRFKPEESDGEVTPAEADLIKRLISAAIQEGVLERTFDRVIEHGFNEELIPGVRITGFIDMMDCSGITDHKSLKRMRYAKSRAALKNDIQLKIYAWFWLKLLGEEAPTTVMLRHNQFCKDPDDLRVRKTEVDITAEEIQTFWVELKENARQMVNFRAKAESWHDLPDPRTGAGACNAYGGCPFRSICGGQETEEQYEERISRWAALQESTTNNTPQENPMTLLDKLAALSAANVNVHTSATPGIGTPGTVTINPPAPVATAMIPAPIMVPAPIAVPQVQPVILAPAPITPQPAPTPQPGPAMQPNMPTMQFKASTQPDAVPWAVDGCGACRGWGFNTRGMPCPICRVNAKKCAPALPDSELFTLTPTGDGRVYWELKANTSVAGTSPYMSGGAVVAVEAKVAPVVAPAPVQTPAPQPAPVVQVVPQPVHAPAPTMGTVNRGGVLSPVEYLTAPAPQAVKFQDLMRPEVDSVMGASALAPAPTPTEDPDVAAKRRGRPKKGFILAINCVVAKGEERLNSGRGVHHLADVLRKYGAMLAAQYVAAGKLKAGQTHHDINAFDRRDELAKIVESIAETFSSDIVVADLTHGTPDLRALAEALRPWAGMEIVGGVG